MCIRFQQMEKTTIKEDFGGKAIIDFNNNPMFAEIAIVNMLIKSGWEARWIETYGRPKNNPKILSSWDFNKKYKDQTEDPIKDKITLRHLSKISKLNNNSYSGCWDVIGWKGKKILFLESKKRNEDNIRETQKKWLICGLKSGLSINNFIIVEWQFSKK